MKGNNGMQFLIRLTTVIVLVVAIVSSVSLANYPADKSLGDIMLGISIIAGVLLILENVLFSNNIKKTISRLSTKISRTEKDSMMNFPAAAIIIDSDNSIVWYNRLFSRKMYSQQEAYGQKLTDVMNIDMDKIYSENGDLVCLDKRFYTARAVHTDSAKTLSMIYFSDTTDYVELEYESRQSHKSVIFIMIDNYDDMMSNVLESEKAHTMVDIECLVENFVSGTNGVSKRLSNDKFFIIMEERFLSKVIENRFKILEAARAIKVNGKQSVTISVGVGRYGENLAESEKFAKQAMDMCLGRGGDQAAVKTETGFEFFGGVSKGIEKHTKVRSRMMAGRLHDLAIASDKIYIMGHRFGDLDSVGSATGLSAAFKYMGIESYVVVDMEKNLSKSLIKYVTDNNIEKYYITPEEAISRISERTLLIVVDTHNSELVDSKELLARIQNVVVIDHHRLMVKAIENCALFYHEPMASSASEMVTELIEYLDDNVVIQSTQAEALLAGIMLDTKNFVMRTGIRTFEAAAYLKKLGADTIAVKKLFANSIETYQQKSILISNAEVYRKCAIACTDEGFNNIRIAASQAADELLGISGVNASFVIYEDNGMSNISARSMGGYNVQIIMEAMGGGGHQSMAATQLNISAEDARKQLVGAIDEYIRNNVNK